ncbi:MAG: SDR family oxidoreductase [Hydrococcus sp. Prado102]|nr:SDR family oxidoreductase [Hydrococcus sp. Prado102]
MDAQDSHCDPEKISGLQLEVSIPEQNIASQHDTNRFEYCPANKLQGKVALITGGDSQISQAVAIAFALEGADIAILYNELNKNTREIRAQLDKIGGKYLTIKGNFNNFESCRRAVEQAIVKLGKLNIIVNNVISSIPQQRLEDISEEQFRRALETNVVSYFNMVKAAVPYLNPGDAIVNTGAIAINAMQSLSLDYAVSKEAVHSFTKALALNLSDRQIRVNTVVARPAFTSATIAKLELSLHQSIPPEDLAPAYVFLASQDSNFVTGALLDITNGRLSIGD